MLINTSIIFLLTSIITVSFCRKYNFLLDKKSEKHKKYLSNHKSHLIGGFLLFLSLFYFFLFIEIDFFLLSFLFIIFVIGLFSDLKKINSVYLRFFFQIFSIICFVNLLDIEINNTKILIIDSLLKYHLFNVFFVTFCLTVLINGTNFIDGVNGVTIKYFLIIYLIKKIFFNDFAIDQQIINFIISILSILLVFNLLGFLYLGDSGSYLISIFTGIFLIDFAINNQTVSPYFIIVLLWYPCFELLFSMIRRFLNKKKTYRPDTKHLHQVIFMTFQKKFRIQNNLTIHFLTSLIINTFNIISFIFAINYIHNSIALIIILLFNVTSYSYVFFLFKKNKN